MIARIYYFNLIFVKKRLFFIIFEYFIINLVFL